MKKEIKYILILLLSLILSIQGVLAQTEAVIDFSEASIEEIQEYVDAGFLTYETITKIYLERIEAYSEQYQSIITVNPHALDEARALDILYENEGKLSKLHGIPIIVKDNIDVKGLPTTSGAKGLLQNIAKEDATVVKNLRDAGAIFIAKANMDEFAFNAGMSSSMFGLVRNAYDLNISSYGSSGGTASAVASNLAVVGLGTDTGTSIRVPSAANNLYGLRPSKDSVSDQGIINFEFLRDTVGPMAKHAADAKLVYQIMSGNTDDTSYDMSQLRIGVLVSEVEKAPQFIKKMVQEKIDILKASGVSFVDVSRPKIIYSFDASNFCYDFNQYIKGTEGPIQSLQDLINSGGYTQYIAGYSGYYCNHDYTKTSDFKAYLNMRQQNIKSAQTFFENNQIDALLYPTLAEKLKPLSSSIYNAVASYSYAIPPQTGFPGLNIPIGFHDGVPYGMELVGVKNSDLKLLEIANYLDSESPSYHLPEISPSLYTPIPQIETLREYIDNSHFEQEYQEVQESMRYFLEHYPNMQDRSATADRLIAIYKEVPSVLEDKKQVENQLKKYKTQIIASAIVEVGLLGVLVYLIKFKINVK